MLCHINVCWPASRVSVQGQHAYVHVWLESTCSNRHQGTDRGSCQSDVLLLMCANTDWQDCMLEKASAIWFVVMLLCFWPSGTPLHLSRAISASFPRLIVYSSSAPAMRKHVESERTQTHIFSSADSKQWFFKTMDGSVEPSNRFSLMYIWNVSEINKP